MASIMTGTFERVGSMSDLEGENGRQSDIIIIMARDQVEVGGQK